MAGLFERLQSEIETRRRVEGIAPADLLELSPELGRLIGVMLRQGGMSLAEIVLQLDMRPSEVKKLLDTLSEKGYLKTFEIDGEQRYKTFLARKRGREMSLNIWEALDGKV